MTRFRFALASLLVAALAGVAIAQPTPQPGPDQGPPPPQPQPSVHQPAPIDEAKVREMVDREVARIIADREAKLAAEHKAAEETAASAAPGAGEDYLSGSNGFMDVRLAFTLTNENMLVKPGETIPSVPGWRFGRPNSLGTLFFDNYDTRFSGYETLSTAVMYRDYQKDHLEVEGAFVLRMNELSERRIDFSDAGSYIYASWWKDPTHTDKTRYSLTAFPISADRFRLGYSYRLSWGGSEEYRRSTQAVPGIKLQYDAEKVYAFVGAKSAVVLDPETAEQVAVLGFLGGAGYDVNDKVRVETNFGYFNKGGNELEDVNT